MAFTPKAYTIAGVGAGVIIVGAVVTNQYLLANRVVTLETRPAQTITKTIIVTPTLAPTATPSATFRTRISTPAATTKGIK